MSATEIDENVAETPTKPQEGAGITVQAVSDAPTGGRTPPEVSAGSPAVSETPLTAPDSVPAPTAAVASGQAGTGTKVIQVSTVVTGVSSQTAGAGSGLGPVAVPQTGPPTTGVAPASKVTRVATISHGPPVKGAVIALPRAAAPRTTLSTTVQLPANFQIPQGMVLIRSDSGQLMLVSQQALAQAQAQGMVPRRSVGATSGPLVRMPVPQASTSALMNKPDATRVIKVPPPPNGVPVTSFPKVSLVKAVSGTVQTASPTVRPALTTSGNAPLIIPAKSEAAKATPPATISTETLENVKKCKNFLVTLIKLASSGTHSAEMATNVKELVKNLLDGKIEPEEFTDRLYTELKSSPQPYLVPFLKRSLPAVRQLTPNSQLFIQQCDPQPASKLPPTTAAVSASAPVVSKALQSGASLSQAQKPAESNRPMQLVIHQPRGLVIKPSVTAAQSTMTAPVLKSLPALRTPVLQTAVKATGAIIKQPPLQVSRMISMQPPQVQKNSFRDSTPPTFRDDDDINDVASMAGVNLNEESARILATNSEHVGSVVHSCRDDPFLPPSVLHKRILETGKRHGIADVSLDAVSLVSHATQERLKELLEKLTAVAYHRNKSHRDDIQHRQTSDTRLQLKFLEQLDRVEKRRKEQEEREILLRVAKSRSNREDPERLRLKQKAKEMQQLELAQMQQRDANLTALAAIGPRKKRPLESLGCGSGTEVPGVLPPSVRSSLQKVTRVCLRDLLFCMEQDLSLRHSVCLYRALLR